MGNNRQSRISSFIKAKIPLNSEFFLQNEIEKIARDLGQMSQLIKNRLNLKSSLINDDASLSDIENEWNNFRIRVDDLIESFDNLSQIDNDIAILNKENENLKNQIAIIKSNEYKDLVKEVEKISNEIYSFERFQEEYHSLQLKTTWFMPERNGWIRLWLSTAI